MAAGTIASPPPVPRQPVGSGGEICGHPSAACAAEEARLVTIARHAASRLRCRGPIKRLRSP